MYEASSRAIAAVSPRLKFGGPNTGGSTLNSPFLDALLARAVSGIASAESGAEAEDALAVSLGVAGVLAECVLHAAPEPVTAGVAREEGDRVVLREGLAEKEGLKAGELAIVRRVSYLSHQLTVIKLRRHRDGEELSGSFQSADLATAT